jgi:hypothetical protein
MKEGRECNLFLRCGAIKCRSFGRVRPRLCSLLKNVLGTGGRSFSFDLVDSSTLELFPHKAASRQRRLIQLPGVNLP